MKIKIINIPKEVFDLAKILNNDGYQAYLVGGAVRDLLMGVPSHDLDLATNATPIEMNKLFASHNIRTIPTGEQYGTITVMLNKIPFEITTFRKDSTYSDGRRPDAVTFSKTIKDDLSRRDFTINAISINLKTLDIVDPFGGQKDLKSKTLKAVGVPTERFSEDALRLLRAVRFACRFNFTIDEKTLAAMKENASKIKNVSPERIKKELDGILLTTTPSEGFNVLLDTGILDLVLPEVSTLAKTEQNNPYHFTNVFNHTMLALDSSSKNVNIRWAILLHDTGKPIVKTTDETGRDKFIGHADESEKIADSVMRRLKFDNYAMVKIKKLIVHHQDEVDPDRPNKVKQFMKIIDNDLEDWIDMRKSDMKAHHPDRVDLTKITNMHAKIKDVLNKKEPYKISQLTINGKDLISLGFVQGPHFQNILQELLNLVVMNPEYNTREFLLGFVEKHKSRLMKGK
jgi:tRNA nucleotidyltransferase (CCA-adding enzyme)